MVMVQCGRSVWGSDQLDTSGFGKVDVVLCMGLWTRLRWVKEFCQGWVRLLWEGRYMLKIFDYVPRVVWYALSVSKEQFRGTNLI